MLSVSSLSKSYGKNNIVNNISFSLNRGEIVGLVGENGAGKSTLLKMLATLSEPSSGSISLESFLYTKDIKGVRKKIGFVPQEIAIWEDLTVKENMRFFEKLCSNNKSTEELHQLCLDMKLEKWEEPVKSLSGGMQRKLNIAISLIQDPELLLLDEPTVGIDLKSKNEIGTYLKKIAQENGTMILFTSHDMDEIMRVCDRILCIGKDTFYQSVLEEAGVNPQVL